MPKFRASLPNGDEAVFTCEGPEDVLDQSLEAIPETLYPTYLLLEVEDQWEVYTSQHAYWRGDKPVLTIQVVA